MAGLPVVFGWGKKGKVIGYVGIDKCPNCKQYVHFSIYEYSNRINVYFVPVAKFNKKHYLVCPVCEAAYELTGELKEHYFYEMFNSMSPEDTEEIFSESMDIISENFINVFEQNDINTEDKVEILINKCVERLNDKYNNENYIDKIARIALKCLFDQDKAK